MTIPSKNEARMAEAIEDAEIAFWSVIVDAYPEATHGDFSPEATFALDAALKEAVTLWLEWNADPQESEQKVAEIMLHRIEYNYRGGHNALLLTDGDKEHIAYSISQGISEGELCTMLEISPVRSEEVYGYWKINNNPDA